MIENSAVLSPPDAEVVARYFLYHLGQDERRLLMADLPLVYARMYPGVSAEILAGQVSAMIDLQRDTRPAREVAPPLGPDRRK